jgi:hypothetical protein
MSSDQSSDQSNNTAQSATKESAMTTGTNETALYPNPTQVAKVADDAVYNNLRASLVRIYVRPRMTWDGRGFDIVHDAVVCWKRRRDDGALDYGCHVGATVRSSLKNGVEVHLCNGLYDMTEREAQQVALERAPGWPFIAPRGEEVECVTPTGKGA